MQGSHRPQTANLSPSPRARTSLRYFEIVAIPDTAITIPRAADGYGHDDQRDATTDRAAWMRSPARHALPARRGRRRCTCGIRPIAARSTCESPPMGLGSTRRPRSAGCLWSNCSPPSSSARGTSYFLVTPVEKCGIAVDDAPFLAVEMQARSGSGRPDAQVPHQCRRLGDVRPGQCVALRAGGGNRRTETLSACPARPLGQGHAALFYDLVALGEERDVEGRRMFGVVSQGAFFAMAPADALKEFA